MEATERGSPFPCPHCSDRFRTESTWRTHLSLHKNPTRWQCPTCWKTFKGGTSLKNHIRGHQGVKGFACPKCGKSFGQKANMEKHLDTHEDSRPFPCALCGRAFTRKSHLQGHVANVHHKIPKKFQCSFCDARFYDKSKAKQHEKQFHSKNRTYYKCYFCSTQFLASSSLEIHLRNHTLEIPFKCTAQSCPKRLKRQQSLARHQVSAHYKKVGGNVAFITSPRICYFCNHASATSSSLSEHIRTHTEERPFKCEGKGCSWSFKYVSHLIRHRKRKEGDSLCMQHKKQSSPLQQDSQITTLPIMRSEEIVVPEEIQTVPVLPDPRLPLGSTRELRGSLRFKKCLFCQVANFKSKQDYVDHMNSRHGFRMEYTKKPQIPTIRPKTECYFCHKSFTLPSLKSHMTKHVKEIQEKCEGCHQKFRTMAHLRTHWSKSCTQLMTMEKKTYPCKFCGKVYSVWKSLVDHMNGIHLGQCEDYVECFLTCGNKFRTVPERDLHMSQSHPDAGKAWSCTMGSKCGESFYTKRLLNCHLARAHPKTRLLGRQPFRKRNKCLICYIFYKRRSDFVTHMTQVHGYREHSLETTSVFNSKIIKISTCMRHDGARSKRKRRRIIMRTCYFCGKRMPPTSLPQHMAQHTRERRPGQECGLCGKSFTNWASLRQHDKRRHPNVPGVKIQQNVEKEDGLNRRVKCGICRSSFQGESELTNHLQSSHFLELKKREGRKPQKLVTMVRISKIKKKLKGKKKKSKKEESGGPWTCSHPTCQLQFTSKLHLKCHEQNHLTPEERRNLFKCSNCPKSFLRRAYLTTHKREFHHKDGPPTCHSCNKTFSSRSALLTHSQQVHAPLPPEQYLTCKMCPSSFKSYKSQHSFNQHLKIVHSQKSFHCTECRKSFSSRAALVQHAPTHTDPKRRKHVQCPICNKNMLETSLFGHRLLMHPARDARVTCTHPNCGKSFPSKSYLASHVKRHCTERQFQCALCPYKAKMMTDLRYHISRHTGETPWKCGMVGCGKCFKTSTSLRQHDKIVHQKIGTE